MTDETTFERRSVLNGIGGTIALTGFAGHGAADGSDTEEVHIGLEDDATREEAEAEIAADSSIPDGAEIVHYNDAIDFAVVEVPKEPSVLSTDGGAVELLSEPSAIKYSEERPDPEPCVVDSEPAAVTPNDPRWDDQYGSSQVNADEVWEETYGSEDVTVSIVDTGVDIDHPDLDEQVADDPGGYYIDRGDSGTHGTHCAGIAAATTGNGTGIAGNSNSSLKGFRAIQAGRGSTPTATAITESADQGADVINMSFSTGGYYRSLGDALEYATEQGTLCIAASGNDGQQSRIAYPGRDPNVLAVGATNWRGDVVGFSNSSEELDVVAPVASIYSTVPGGYGRKSGTSMASPCAVGVAALALAANPSLSPQELKEKMRETAAPMSGVPDYRQGAGQLDAAALVDAVSDGGGGGGSDDATTGSLAFPDQTLGDDGAVTVSDVSSDGDAAVVVTYADGDQNVVAGVAGASDAAGSDIEVAVEDAGGFPGTHTAWIFALSDVEGIQLGDDATPIAGSAFDSDSAAVSDGDGGGGDTPDNPEWDSGATYTGGDRVVYDGAVWEASWWTQGDEPGSSEWGPWEKVKDIGGGGDGGDGDDGGDGGDDGSDDYPQWDPMSLYEVGDRVTYDGSTWEASLASLNAQPGPNSAYWSPVN